MRSVIPQATIRARAGISLAEILVAMLVLLVGIYTVARGFPLMLEAIRGEADRTRMARLSEEAMERLRDTEAALPEAITGGADLNPYILPEDLTDDTRPVNSLEHTTRVVGETFEIPPPALDVGTSVMPDGGYSLYPFRQGLAQWWDFSTEPVTAVPPRVYMLVPLEERRDDPRVYGTPAGMRNWFYVDAAEGLILVPASVVTQNGGNARSWDVGGVVADYAWAEQDTTPTGQTVVRDVQQERIGDFDDSVVPHEARVYPAGLPVTLWGNIVPGSARVWARVNFVRRDIADDLITDPLLPGEFAMEPLFGAMLRFHPQDAGLTVKADYHLRTDTAGRRTLIMIEDHVIRAAADRVEDPDGTPRPFTDVRFAARGVDDEPLFAGDLSGNQPAGWNDVHVLAVDLQTGQIYTDGAGSFTLYDPDLAPPLENGWQEGILSLPTEISGALAPYIGHTMRFYYRTLDRHAIQVQMAPRTYIDSVTASAYPADRMHQVAYRMYRLVTNPTAGNADLSIGTLQFGQWLEDETDPSAEPDWAEAPSSSGMTVAVDYAYWADPADPFQRFVYGELHTISPTGTQVALNSPTVTGYPFTILSVRGVSARARATWLTTRGNLRTLSVEGAFLSAPLEPVGGSG